MEGEPLIPGYYAGPVKRDLRKRLDVRTFTILYWLRDVTMPPAVFIATAVLVAAYHGPGVLLQATVGVFEALMCGALVAALLRAHFLSAAAYAFGAVAVGVVSTYNNFGLVAAVASILFCVGMARKSAKHGRAHTAFMFVLLFVAAGSGAAYGKYVHFTKFMPFDDFRSLVTYINIDPNTDKGGSYRDAGEVYFKEGSRVDITRALAVKSKDVYCVAPIVRNPATPQGGGPIPPPDSGTVDWWAVGINCCKPDGEAFSCGLALTARAGLRLLRDDVRHLYALGVDEWSSKFESPVKHPLFFEWVTDPLADVSALRLGGWSDLLQGSQSFAVMNLLLATLGFQVISIASGLQ